MMNEEEYLRTRMSGRNPFSVPEGYFEQLPDSIMSRLPERRNDKKPTLFVRLRPVLYAAACMLAVVLSATLYFNSSGSEEATATVIAQESTISASYVEDAVDYVMADNNDIYACLSGE